MTTPSHHDDSAHLSHGTKPDCDMGPDYGMGPDHDPGLDHGTESHHDTGELRVPRVLSIAGTDPSGGAGTAADMKSITAAGGYGMTVVTSLVAQNTTGVRSIHVPPVEFLRDQLAAVADDVHLDAVKTGMLANVAIIETVHSWLAEHRPATLVVDPVMVATSGDRLLAPEAEQAMCEYCATADVVTPNIPELAVLVGTEPATDVTEAIAQATDWAQRTQTAVIVKTGHLDGASAANIWVAADGHTITVPSTRIDTTNTHGTGCSLSSALATRLGAGDAPGKALAWTTAWLHESIAHGAALQVGSGHGPVDHGHRTRRLARAGMATPWLAEDCLPGHLDSPDQLAPTAEPVQAAIPAPGPWTQALWRAGLALTRQVASNDFVTQLVGGTLPDHAFRFYLGQDARYLQDYAKALAGLAARTDAVDETTYWSYSAYSSQVEEAELHRTWLAGEPTVAPSPVTQAYTNFLLTSVFVDAYVVGAAAVLPCYWIYAQTGAQMPRIPDEHPYAAWLHTYHDDEFVQATAQALAIVERAFALAAPQARSRAARAYLTACRHEMEFFDQALRIGPDGPGCDE